MRPRGLGQRSHSSFTRPASDPHTSFAHKRRTSVNGRCCYSVCVHVHVCPFRCSILFPLEYAHRLRPERRVIIFKLPVLLMCVCISRSPPLLQPPHKEYIVYAASLRAPAAHVDMSVQSAVICMCVLLSVALIKVTQNTEQRGVGRSVCGYVSVWNHNAYDCCAAAMCTVDLPLWIWNITNNKAQACVNRSRWWSFKSLLIITHI